MLSDENSSAEYQVKHSNNDMLALKSHMKGNMLSVVDLARLFISVQVTLNWNMKWVVRIGI